MLLGLASGLGLDLDLDLVGSGDDGSCRAGERIEAAGGLLKGNLG
jgi:hypothetical protein